jgi:hypothetical protein
MARLLEVSNLINVSKAASEATDATIKAGVCD